MVFLLFTSSSKRSRSAISFLIKSRAVWLSCSSFPSQTSTFSAFSYISDIIATCTFLSCLSAWSMQMASIHRKRCFSGSLRRLSALSRFGFISIVASSAESSLRIWIVAVSGFVPQHHDSASYFSFFRCLMWHFISSSSLPGRITRIRKVLPSRGLCLYATMLSSFATKLN
jgi:hypothetical protein